MQAGLIAAYDALQLFAAASFDCSLSDATRGAKGSSGLASQFAPNAATLTPGVEIAFQTAVAVTTGAGSSSATVSIPGLDWSQSVTTAAWQGSFSASVTIHDYRLYQTNLAWLLSWSSIDVVIGTSSWTLAAGSLTNSFLVPGGVPLLGVPPRLSCPAAIDPAQESGVIPGSTTPGSGSWSCSGSASGGYQVKELGSGIWTAFPITLRVVKGGVTGCPCEPTLVAAVGASDTASLSCEASMTQTASCVDGGRVECWTCPDGETALVPAIFEVYKTTAEQFQTFSSVMALPNTPKCVKRMGPDYAALVFRGGLPQVTAAYTDSCFDFVADESTGYVSETIVTHPRESSFLAKVGNATHVIESPLGLDALAPYGIFADHKKASAIAYVLLQPGSCPSGGGPAGGPRPCFPTDPTACEGTLTSVLPASVDDLAGNPQMIPALDHVDDVTRYVNYWSAPHWSFGLWFPPDVTDGSGLKPWEWPLFDARANPSVYWLPARTQWMWNPLLPSGEATKTRTDIIAEPLASGALAAFVAGWFGSLTSWWGIHRFQVQTVTLPATVILGSDESADWSFAGCTASFGPSSITLTPSGSPCSASLALGSFARDPRQILLLARSWTSAWSGLGIATAVAQLIGVDGTVVDLGSAPGTYDFPIGIADAKYAGDWAQDYGVGFTALDVGSDSAADGISASEMVSDQGVYAFELPFGFTVAELKFTFSLSDSSQPIELAYPIANMSSLVPTVVPLTGMTFALLWPSGAGVRLGQWSWWNDLAGAWQDPPAVAPFGKVSTALDWLAGRRVAFQGIAAESGLDAEIATLYDAVEGQARSDLASGTLGFPTVVSADLTGVLVNSQAEAPPLAIHPRRARDANLQPTGDFALESWSHTQEPRYVVSAQRPADLCDAYGSQWTGFGGPSVPGWDLRRHSHAVTNSEGTSFGVVAGGTRYGAVSPWHGYFAVLFPDEGGGPTNCETEAGEHLMVYVQSGDLHAKWSPFAGAEWAYSSRITGDGGWSCPRVCLDYRRRIELRAVRAAHAYRFVSDDDARTWSSPELVL